YCTVPTVDMTEIVLMDAAKIAEEDARYEHVEPLYNRDDVVKLMSFMEGRPYRTEFAVGNLQVKFWDAGHILGSAVVELYDGKKRIIFSGDLGNYPVLLLKKPDLPTGADVLVVESTYGDRVHEDVYMRKLLLKEAVCSALSVGGVVMIPAFAMERTQELLYVFNDYAEREKMCKGNIYLDSPMAHRMTEVFKKYTEYLNEEAQWFLSTEDDIFDFPQLKITDTVDESKAINKDTSPKVIIAGSGMMSGGRIKHHLKHYLSDQRNVVFVVGYQVAGTLGRSLFDGAKEVTIFGEKVKVRAKIMAVGAFSAHADRNRILQWIASMENLPQTIFLNHGEKTAKESLRDKINQTLRTEAVVSEYNKEFEL
ncbi:MBL fold metallo-hydrolase, partial [Patescibacteria group bacterium]|nr:MBL fold metallo-hydrolase [Patescibacteria group bacterium]